MELNRQKDWGWEWEAWGFFLILYFMCEFFLGQISPGLAASVRSSQFSQGGTRNTREVEMGEMEDGGRSETAAHRQKSSHCNLRNC